MELPYVAQDGRLRLSNGAMNASSWHWASFSHPATLDPFESGGHGISNLLLVPSHGQFIPDATSSMRAPLLCIARALETALTMRSRRYGELVSSLRPTARGQLTTCFNDQTKLDGGIPWCVDRYEYMHELDKQLGRTFIFPFWLSYQMFAGNHDRTMVKPTNDRLLSV